MASFPRNMFVTCVALSLILATAGQFPEINDLKRNFGAPDYIQYIPCPIISSIYRSGFLKPDSLGRVTKTNLQDALVATGCTQPMSNFQAAGHAAFLLDDVHQNVKNGSLGASTVAEGWINIFTMQPEADCNQLLGKPNQGGFPCNANPAFQQHGYSTFLRDARFPNFTQNFEKGMLPFLEKPPASWNVSEKVMRINGFVKLLQNARARGDYSSEFSKRAEDPWKGSNIYKWHTSVTQTNHYDSLSVWEPLLQWTLFWRGFARIDAHGNVFFTESMLRDYFIRGQFPASWKPRTFGFHGLGEFYKTQEYGKGIGDDWMEHVAECTSVTPADHTFIFNEQKMENCVNNLFVNILGVPQVSWKSNLCLPQAATCETYGFRERDGPDRVRAKGKIGAGLSADLEGLKRNFSAPDYIQYIPCPMISSMYRAGFLKPDSLGRVTKTNLQNAFIAINCTPPMSNFQAAGHAVFLLDDVHQNVKNGSLGASKVAEGWINIFTMQPEADCNALAGKPNQGGFPCNANPQFQQHGYSTFLRDARYPDFTQNFEIGIVPYLEDAPASFNVSEKVMTVPGFIKMLKNARERGDYSSEFSKHPQDPWMGSNIHKWHRSVTQANKYDPLSVWEPLLQWTLFWNGFITIDAHGNRFFTESTLRDFFIRGQFPASWKPPFRQFGWRGVGEFYKFAPLVGNGLGDEWMERVMECTVSTAASAFTEQEMDNCVLTLFDTLGINMSAVPNGKANSCLPQWASCEPDGFRDRVVRVRRDRGFRVRYDGTIEAEIGAHEQNRLPVSSLTP